MTKPREAAKPNNDLERVSAIRQAGLLQVSFKSLEPQIKRAAAEFRVPTAAVTLVGRHFQFLKTSTGTDLNVMHRDRAFCSHTLLTEAVMVVEDATKDARFSDNPFVTADPFIRFYAGARLGIGGGHWIGAVCLMDSRPRSFTRTKRDRLVGIACEIEADLRRMMLPKRRLRPYDRCHELLDDSSAC